MRTRFLIGLMAAFLLAAHLLPSTAAAEPPGSGIAAKVEIIPGKGKPLPNRLRQLKERLLGDHFAAKTRAALDGFGACLRGFCCGGITINAYSPDPNDRVNELLNNSEDLRQIRYEWERIWFTDQPSHLTPERVNGGVQ